MLYDIDEKVIDNMPHQKDYDRWIQNLSRKDYHGVIEAVHEVLDEASNKEIPVYSSRIPGKYWAGTPFYLQKSP